MLDEIRAEFARHLSEDPTGRWRMDAALAHVATMAYEQGLRTQRTNHRRTKMTGEAIEQGFARLAIVLSMPQEKKLWNAEAVAEYFGLSASAVYRSILCKPTFLKPSRSKAAASAGSPVKSSPGPKTNANGAVGRRRRE